MGIGECNVEYLCRARIMFLTAVQGAVPLKELAAGQI